MNRVKISSRLCKAEDVGRYGRLFGGNLMAWIDEAAAIYALQCTGEPDIVTYRYSAMTFNRPVFEGDIIEIYCGNLKKGNTSICFDLTAEVLGTPVLQTECVFVAVGNDGRKKQIEWPDA